MMSFCQYSASAQTASSLEAARAQIASLQSSKERLQQEKIGLQSLLDEQTRQLSDRNALEAKSAKLEVDLSKLEKDLRTAQSIVAEAESSITRYGREVLTK